MYIHNEETNFGHVVGTHTGGQVMAKKPTIVLSAQELRARKNAISIGRKVKDSEIDFSDIPELDEEVLNKIKRRGRPIIGDSPRKAISVRIEEDVLAKLKAKAKKRGVPYQSLINEILKKAV